MKKRRVKLLALALTVCLGSGSVLSVSAADRDSFTSEESGTIQAAGFQAEETETEVPETEESVKIVEEMDVIDSVMAEEPEDTQREVSVKTVTLGVDAVWAVDEEDSAPANTFDKKLYKIEKGEKTDDYYKKEDGFIEVKNTVGESYTYYFDDNGYLQVSNVLAEGNTYFFLPKDMVEGAEDEDLPKIGRMQKDFWVQDESLEWVYFGEDGAQTKGQTTKKDVYVLGTDVQWKAYTKEDGETFYRLLDLNAGSGKYFVLGDGLVNVKAGGASDEVHTYFFENQGRVAEDIQVVDGKVYYFITQKELGEGKTPLNSLMGAMLKEGWVLLDDGKIWGYFGKDGVRTDKIGYVEINGEHYYLGEGGTIVTGLVKIDGKELFFSPSTNPMGQQRDGIEEGWVKDGNAWKYRKADGTLEIRTGFQKIKSGSSEKWYFLDEDGVPMKNVMERYTNGKYYYFGTNGIRIENKFAKVENKEYYFTAYGARADYKNTWKTINNKKYYFGSDSSRVRKTGWQHIGKYWYYFSSNGNLYVDRLLTINGQKYLVNKYGAMMGGLKEYKGYLYYFKRSQGNTQYGYALKSSWVKVGGKWYYANSAGRMQKGWIALGTKKYYLDANYVLVTDKWLTHPTEGRGYVDSDGLFHKGNTWVNVKGNWRYLLDGASGGYATGWTRIGGYKYYFKSNGDLMTDLSNMAGFTGGPYLYDVNRTTCTVTVLGRDENGQYTVPVIAFACSVGLPGTPTPHGGPYTMQREGRWQCLMGPSWGQYGTHVLGAGSGGIYFHSVAGSAPNHYALNPVEYNRLGSPASHGCIRLTVRDAKWIWDHWGAGGNRAQVVDRSGNIFYKPSVPKVGPNVHYDPTDPAI